MMTTGKNLGQLNQESPTKLKKKECFERGIGSEDQIKGKSSKNQGKEKYLHNYLRGISLPKLLGEKKKHNSLNSMVLGSKNKSCKASASSHSKYKSSGGLKQSSTIIPKGNENMSSDSANEFPISGEKWKNPRKRTNELKNKLLGRLDFDQQRFTQETPTFGETDDLDLENSFHKQWIQHSIPKRPSLEDKSNQVFHRLKAKLKQKQDNQNSSPPPQVKNTELANELESHKKYSRNNVNSELGFQDNQSVNNGKKDVHLSKCIQERIMIHQKPRSLKIKKSNTACSEIETQNYNPLPLKSMHHNNRNTFANSNSHDLSIQNSNDKDILFKSRNQFKSNLFHESSREIPCESTQKFKESIDYHDNFSTTDSKTASNKTKNSSKFENTRPVKPTTLSMTNFEKNYFIYCSDSSRFTRNKQLDGNSNFPKSVENALYRKSQDELEMVGYKTISPCYDVNLKEKNRKEISGIGKKSPESRRSCFNNWNYQTNYQTGMKYPHSKSFLHQSKDNNNGIARNTSFCESKSTTQNGVNHYKSLNLVHDPWNQKIPNRKETSLSEELYPHLDFNTKSISPPSKKLQNNTPSVKCKIFEFGKSLDQIKRVYNKNTSQNRPTNESVKDTLTRDSKITLILKKKVISRLYNQSIKKYLNRKKIGTSLNIKKISPYLEEENKNNNNATKEGEADDTVSDEKRNKSLVDLSQELLTKFSSFPKVKIVQRRPHDLNFIYPKYKLNSNLAHFYITKIHNGTKTNETWTERPTKPKNEKDTEKTTERSKGHTTREAKPSPSKSSNPSKNKTQKPQKQRKQHGWSKTRKLGENETLSPRAHHSFYSSRRIYTTEMAKSLHLPSNPHGHTHSQVPSNPNPNTKNQNNSINGENPAGYSSQQHTDMRQMQNMHNPYDQFYNNIQNTSTTILDDIVTPHDYNIHHQSNQHHQQPQQQDSSIKPMTMADFYHSHINNSNIVRNNQFNAFNEFNQIQEHNFRREDGGKDRVLESARDGVSKRQYKLQDVIVENWRKVLSKANPSGRLTILNFRNPCFANKTSLDEVDISDSQKMSLRNTFYNPNQYTSNIHDYEPPALFSNAKLAQFYQQ